MKERPILFSGPMVRALLAGRKTQTRRVVAKFAERKMQPFTRPNGTVWLTEHHRDPLGLLVDSPFGWPGDRLWVRETWGVGTRPDQSEGWRDGVEYRADTDGLGTNDFPPLYRVETPAGVELDSYAGRWHPSIHMPRWASRLTLEITGVRVQRLQEITEADAKAEGVGRGSWADDCSPGDDVENAENGYFPPRSYVAGFAPLWNVLNESRGYGWDANPWVFAISFRRIV